ncbi:hypothetical protein GBA65_22190 (plasmid) [Rubrobacter marinus]|uniref:Uncharacterized protein n=1 Tax=Rubrobacter marinus TaxID=2653852 RepID=A0A6G8Q3W1_9ACTN|nr:hypothetical protein [Rubrobacter marinus]QIN81146.1 hypothetical protein GBA65_22190 [Rubrobacter marinus]
MDTPGGEASYELENITPTAMSLVDRATERKAVDNRIDNRKNLVDTYACPECGEAFTTVSTHAGAVPFVTDCETVGCGGDASCSTAESRVHVDGYEGQIDYEWYRPLTREECETTISLIETEASSLAEDPRIPQTGGTRAHYVELKKKDRVGHLLGGGLLRRPHQASRRL